MCVVRQQDWPTTVSFDGPIEEQENLAIATEVPVDLPETVDDVSTIDPAIEREIEQFSVLYPFPLDAFQRQAIRTFLEGDSVMVAAPTGSGKTVVAEFGMYEAFKRTGRVLYTAPIKALSNQKFRDLRQRYGDDVGLLTGDVTENRDARILVMTTEILRNMLLQSPWELDDVDCVIFDEVHYLADPERGTTWEESIILCPEHVQLICLSATVTNAPEIAGWISRTHRPIRLITHNERPVPLALYYFHDNELTEVVDHHGTLVRDFRGTGGEMRRHGNRGKRRGERNVPAMDEPQPRDIVEALESANLLPAIYFLFSRNDCQAYAERLAMVKPDLMPRESLPAIEAIVDVYTGSMRPEDLELEQVRAVTQLARKGIGFHHAGLLPILKQLVEVLFSRGLMKVVFATDTLALGVNMPARTVVIGRMTKWDGRRRRVLIPNEFQQMAGRAGRRGMDAYGHVVMPYSPWIPFREMLEVATGSLHPVQSAFAIRYNTVLNLWDPPQGDRVRQMLRRSLLQYQANERIRQTENDILEIEAELAGIQGSNPEMLRDDERYEEYQSLVRAVQSLQHKERKLQNDREAIEAGVSSGRPWTVPGRPALRRILTTSNTGQVIHSEAYGWGVFVTRPLNGGVAVCLFDGDPAFRTLTQYSEIDAIADDQRVRIADTIVDSSLAGTETIDPEVARHIHEQLEVLDLPDLNAIAAEWRAEEARQIGEAVAGIDAELDVTRTDLREAIEERNAHPFHDNTLRKAHQKSIEQRDRLARERNQLGDTLNREIEAEELRVRRIIHGIREVLHRFTYMRRGFPTEKADMLADIFDNDGLILCELIDRHILDDLEPAELAELYSWFSFDRDYRYANHFTLPIRLTNVRRKLEELERDVLGEERDLGLMISEGHNPSFYGAAFHWCKGWSMVQIGEQLELSEGDLVLTFNKTIDLMRQMREMLADVIHDHPLRAKLQQAERLLRRGIVEQSLTLGFAPLASDEEDDDPDAPDDADSPDDDAAALT
jgi:ATP-dependent RNA helicase HelY